MRRSTNLKKTRKNEVLQALKQLGSILPKLRYLKNECSNLNFFDPLSNSKKKKTQFAVAEAERERSQTNRSPARAAEGGSGVEGGELVVRSPTGV